MATNTSINNMNVTNGQVTIGDVPAIDGRVIRKMLDVLRENNLEKVHQLGVPELGTYDNPTGKEQPATMVHCDQLTKGALRRLEQNVPGNIHETLQKRVIMIKTCQTNLIYPTNLLDKVCDYRTVTFVHADEQKWYYLDKQQTDEVTVIKIWDMCPHVAFKHPNTLADTPPRESIEVQCFALFD
ncbi:hypothetical protein N7463_003684 [Penicillium fimorum]|uniref:Uncharacterized protein n=1 Tax=Penicillium fimorum TaxID=1882269 RepID=A0A9W9Y1J1_9EURO|nr:hypothetical protein N7463_003684 [Penicillium fimorum]